MTGYLAKRSEVEKLQRGEAVLKLKNLEYILDLGKMFEVRTVVTNDLDSKNIVKNISSKIL